MSKGKDTFLQNEDNIFSLGYIEWLWKGKICKIFTQSTQIQEIWGSASRNLALTTGGWTSGFNTSPAYCFHTYRGMVWLTEFISLFTKPGNGTEWTINHPIGKRHRTTSITGKFPEDKARLMTQPFWQPANDRLAKSKSLKHQTPK